MIPENLMPSLLPLLFSGGLLIGLCGVVGWIYTTRLRIKHGYPLEGMWGQAIKPAITHESIERIRLLSQENAQLRAELGSVKDRLATVERIVTDSGFQVSHEIESLRRGVTTN